MYGTYVTCKLLFAAVKPVTSEYVSTFRVNPPPRMNYLKDITNRPNPSHHYLTVTVTHKYYTFILLCNA